MNLKKIFIGVCISFLLCSPSFAAEEANDTCETKEGKDLYECRLKNICDGGEFNTKKPIYTTEKYEDPSSFKGLGGVNQQAFIKAKELYRKNVGNIYKCGIISQQKKSFKKVKDLLIRMEKTGTLEDKLGKKIEIQIQKADLAASSLNCKSTEDKNLYAKLNILNQTTYEMCKYTVYLEYLKSYYAQITNLVEEDPNKAPDQVTTYPNQYLSTQVFNINQQIDTEIQHTFNVAGTVFHAYTEYENNLPVHLFLQLIKEDYIVIRDKLYYAISPINQVVYKISNAMQK